MTNQLRLPRSWRTTGVALAIACLPWLSLAAPVAKPSADGASPDGASPEVAAPEVAAPEVAAPQATVAPRSLAPERRIELGDRATIFRIPVEGTIDLGLAPFISRVVAEATAVEGGVVLLDINTFGGRVDAAVLIRDALIDAEVPTIAFINPRAISAGALISLACQSIAMTDGGTIGAATPITGGGANEKPEAADEKMLSYMRTEMRATAERRGRRADVAEAMVDRDVEIEGVSPAGKVLTLTTADAVATGIADVVVADLGELLEAFRLTGSTVVERRPNWAERIARAVSHPTLTSFLLSIGFLGIMLELYSPGWGLPGTVGAIALIIFFLGHHVVQLAGSEEILLFFVGLVLIGIEAFLIPGFGVVGIAGIGCVLTGVVMAMVGLDFKVAWDLGLLSVPLSVLAWSMVLTVAGGALLVKLVPATGAVRPLVLGQTLDTGSGFSSHDAAESPVGASAAVLTDLRPAGRIRLADGRRVEAVSEGDYIPAGTAVEVTAVRGGTLVVRIRREPVEPAASQSTT